MMSDLPTKETPAEGALLPLPNPSGVQEQKSCTVYISLGPEGTFKAGTCAHCVIQERGRPARAWDADGDRDLDFARDQLFAELAALGVVLTNRQAYVCP
jgi:hypothetical protein